MHKNFTLGMTACVLSSLPTLAEETEIPRFDVLRTGFVQTGGMDLDGAPGDLSVSRIEARGILAKPLSPWEGALIAPAFAYTATSLDFSGTGAFPIEDEDLHSLSLQTFFVQDFRDSPWFAFAWSRAELATDFQGIQGDDVTFDLAVGMFYKFSEAFTLGFGVAVTNLNGDDAIYPGISFDWAPTDHIRAGLYGPNLLVTYDLNDDWYLSLEGQPGGGNWNIRDAQGASRTIQLDSYWLALSTHHRIAKDFWLSAGVGYTFGNEIGVFPNRGGNGFDRDLDGAPLGRIMLSLQNW